MDYIFAVPALLVSAAASLIALKEAMAYRPGANMERRKTIVDNAYLRELLGVSRQTIDHWRRNGRIPTIAVGEHTFRYDLDAVLAALQLDRERVGLA